MKPLGEVSGVLEFNVMSTSMTPYPPSFPPLSLTPRKLVGPLFPDLPFIWPGALLLFGLSFSLFALIQFITDNRHLFRTGTVYDCLIHGP